MSTAKALIIRGSFVRRFVMVFRKILYHAPM